MMSLGGAMLLGTYMMSGKVTPRLVVYSDNTFSSTAVRFREFHSFCSFFTIGELLACVLSLYMFVREIVFVEYYFFTIRHKLCGFTLTLLLRYNVICFLHDFFQSNATEFNIITFQIILNYKCGQSFSKS